MFYTKLDKPVEIHDMVEVYSPVGEFPYQSEVSKVINVIPEEDLVILADHTITGLGYCSPIQVFEPT